MSRIHEALKKAAQERQAQGGVHSNAELVDLSAEGLARGVLSDNRSPAEGLAASDGDDNAALLRFQHYVKNCPRPAWKTDTNASVFCADPAASGAEPFRTLRSRLYQFAATQPLRRVLVTSSMPAEGKTFIAAKLAQSFARQPNRRVLLIDADLRAARLHLPLGAPTTPGLTEYLREEADESQVIQVGPEGNLCLIAGGRQVSNPSELLHSERMRQLLDKVSENFDWVILDSPPALAVYDASILADMCDGVLFVVRAGATDSTLAERAVSEFRAKNLLGVVLNRVEASDTYGGYYYGYPNEKAIANATSN
jgi:protein-tyrosine kinase